MYDKNKMRSDSSKQQPRLTVWSVETEIVSSQILSDQVYKGRQVATLNIASKQKEVGKDNQYKSSSKLQRKWIPSLVSL